MSTTATTGWPWTARTLRMLDHGARVQSAEIREQQDDHENVKRKRQ
jgi:hypothetical protein